MEPLQSGSYYHIYNHANGNEDLFREEKNYSYFLEKYSKYIDPIANTLAYCLMPNHFHLLVRIKDVDNSSMTETTNAYYYSNQFKNLFQSYTKSVNKHYDRKGSLFNQRFKRKCITSDDFLCTVLIYIHLNPVLHGFCKTPDQWKYSSYSAYFKDTAETKIDITEGISCFGDKANLLYCHKEALIQKYLDKLNKF